jgi:hypothetical protein
MSIQIEDGYDNEVVEFDDMAPEAQWIVTGAVFGGRPTGLE